MEAGDNEDVGGDIGSDLDDNVAAGDNEDVGEDLGSDLDDERVSGLVC